MRHKLFLIFLFVSFTGNAKYMYGTITFKNGHIQGGFIKSFMEKDIIDLNFSSKIEKKFNMDDRSLKFKLTEDGELITYNITEIKEVRFDYTDGTMAIYVPLPIKTFSKKGEIIDMKMLLWLPLVKKGKINLYGFQYSEHQRGVMGTTHYSRFYFQNENDEFAVLPYQKMTIFSRKANIRIRTAFYSYLFSSCPEFYESNTERFRKVIHDDFTREEKKEQLIAEARHHHYYQNSRSYRTIDNAFKISHNNISIFMNEFIDACD